MEAPATAIAIGPGSLIADTYRIERALGEGGMGLVFEAQHLRVSRRVAIKVLREVPDQELLARFRQEAEIASRIGHPNIIDVLDFNTLPSGLPYLVMELLAGESLAARARRGPLPHTQAVPLLRQIASALYAAHGAGVIHRDLKPENVFLVPRELDGVVTDHVKILDFGISKVHGSSAVRTAEDVVLGTPRYMAPEQALGLNDEIDARVDQFALGVIAFELLAGCSPFAGDTSTEVMHEIVYGEPRRLAPLAPDAPTDVVAAIERTLAKRPQDRFDDLSELAHALTGKPLVASPQRARPPTQPHATDAIATQASPRRARATASLATAEPPTMQASPRARTAAPPAEAPDAPRSSRRWWPIAALGLAAAATAIALVSGPAAPAGEPPPRDASAAREGLATGSGSTDSGTAPREAALRGAPIVTTAPADAAVAFADAPAEAPVDAPTVRASRKPEALSAEATAALEQAEQLLRDGRLGAAKVAAERALRVVDHVRARLVLVEVACRGNDLGGVNAAMHALARSHRATARARCARAGFPISDPE